LWQLAAAGAVTADGFDALRALIESKRRLGKKGLRARPRSSSGRWTLLRAENEAIDADAFARGVAFVSGAGKLRRSSSPRS
jgi:hypothetical protein